MTRPATTPAAHSAATPPRTSNSVGTGALWAAGLAALALPFALAFDHGGTGVPTQAVAAVVVLVLLGVCALVAPWPLVERSWPLAAVGLLAAFCAWTAVSAAWSRAVGDAVNDADRVGMYVAAFSLAVVTLRLPGLRRVVPDVLLLGVVVVALYALAGRLLPDLFEVERSSHAGDRLDQPLGYWNAVGILTGFGVLLAAAVAADERRAWWYRALACAAGVPCGLACYLTLSRASWAAVGAGLAVLVLLRPRVTALVAAGLAVGSAGLLAVLLRAFDGALYLDRGEAAQASDGPPVFVAMLVLAAVAGAALAVLLRRGPEGRIARVPRAGALAAGVVAAVLAAGMAISFFSERTEEISKSADRVTSLKTYRGDYWRVGLGSFADHPLAGVGTASFQVEWIRERDSEARVFAFDAHSLYVETMAELGLVGALLLGGLFWAVAGGVRRHWRAVPDDPLLAAGAAVLAAYAVHAGLDWDWEVPSVTLVALLAAAAVVQRPADEP